MSHRSIGRDMMDAKLAGVTDAALRLTLMMKSPYRKHRKAAVKMGEMVAKVQDIIDTQEKPVEA